MPTYTTGKPMKVAASAAGMFARTNTARNVATTKWASGIMTPTNSPSATPRGTERRVKRHSSECSTRCANGRTKRFRSSCSRVGMCR
jgi:hypothetical protein